MKHIRRFLSAVVIVLSLLTNASAQDVVTYFHPDVSGSPTVATDEYGNVLWREDYAPYGERLRQELSPRTNRLWFTGHHQDDDSGLIYAGARHYDPVVGKFLSVDPAAVDPANHFTFNRYAYANNNPYRFVDPDGREPGEAAYGIGVGLVYSEAQARKVQAAEAAVGNHRAASSIEVGIAIKAAKQAHDAGIPAAKIASTMAATYLGLGRKTGDSDKIPDEALVVRGGVATPEQLASGTGPHRDVPELFGYSAQSRDGASAEELAATGGVGNKPFPNGKVSVTTAGELRCLGCDVVRSPGAGANHVTVVADKVQAAQTSSVYRAIPNRARRK